MNFAKKSLGQNFLIDKNIIRKIINLVKLEKKNIIEIGAGHGALTDEILKKKPNLLNIIEKDIFLYYELTTHYLILLGRILQKILKFKTKYCCYRS